MSRFMPKISALSALLSLTLLLAPGAQAAYPSAELLAPALQKSVPVDLAQNELAQAQTNLSRVQGDPLALRADLLAAQARLAQARAGLSAARHALRLSLAQDLAALAAAQGDLRVAQARQQVADVTLSATEVRLKAGAATRLDLEKAQTEARNARSAVEEASASVAAARAAVQTRAGRLPAQATQGTLPAPTLTALQAALPAHPRMLRASAQVDAARQDVAVKSSDLSAPVEVQQARDALAAAQKGAEDTARELRAELSAAWQSYQQALAARQNRERSAAGASRDLGVQEARYQKGLISRLALLQARAEAQSAAAALDAARAGVETALARLAVSANAEVWR